MLPVLPTIVARACAHAAGVAIVDGTGTYTYGQLDRNSAQVAARLLNGRDDLDEARVAFLVSPGFDYVAIQWGIWRAGGIAVPLPMSHPPAELEYLIRDSEATVVIADEENTAVVETLASAVGAKFIATADLKVGTTMAHPAHPTPLAHPTPATPLAHLARRALIVYTSGTTGRPKGVVTTHANLTAQIDSLITAWEWTAADRTLLVLPLHHVHGILNVVCCALWSGATLEMWPKFESEATWDRLASGELTVFTAVPTIYHRLIGSWEAAGPHVQEARSRGC